MGVLSSLRQQNEDKGVLRYRPGEVSAVLSQVQKGIRVTVAQLKMVLSDEPDA